MLCVVIVRCGDVGIEVDGFYIMAAIDVDARAIAILLSLLFYIHQNFYNEIKFWLSHELTICIKTRKRQTKTKGTFSHFWRTEYMSVCYVRVKRYSSVCI